MELEAQGKQVTLVREEPFTTAQDSVEYNVYLMIWKKKRGNRIVEVERFRDDKLNDTLLRVKSGITDEVVCAGRQRGKASE